MHVYIRHMYIAVYLRYYVSLLVDININMVYMTPHRATWKNSYYMLNVLPSLNKVFLLLLLLLYLACSTLYTLLMMPFITPMSITP